MEKGKPSSVAVAAVLFLAISSFKDGVSGITVDINPRNPILMDGQNFTLKCTIAKPLLYCRIKLPGKTSGLSLNELVPKNPDYWYEGEGLKSGQCGITINRIRDSHNGQFECTMATLTDEQEIVGYTNVTVAKAPIGMPDLSVYPDPVGQMYKEDLINARCTVRDSRPAAALSWYIGDDQITDGLSRMEIVESPGNLYTVSQNLSRRLTWRDSGKSLRCTASHIAMNTPRQTVKQIIVVFPPRPKDRQIEKFGLVVGEEGQVIVEIQANPKPYITWNVGGESVPEGGQDSTRRFTASQTTNQGNSTWETILTISAVSPEDVDRKYFLKARNNLGDQLYKVVISTGAAPEGQMMELGTGPIIGIVVAILVVLFIIFMLIFARATGRWCFSGGAPARHDNKESETFLKDSQTQETNPNKGGNPPDEKISLAASAKENESSDTESADHGPSEKSKKPKMNLTYILKKKKDKVAADADDLKLQNVAMENDKELEKPGTESSEHIATPIKGKMQGQDVVYAELDLQATRRPIVRREDEKTEYAEIIHTNPAKGGGGEN